MSAADPPREPPPFPPRFWLAPLTRGGNLAFRRLCVELGAEATVSEMVVVRRLKQRKRSEFALLRSHPSEPHFGVQLADRCAESLAEAATIASNRGARFIDLNCGCPIAAITGRGLGASLLRKPSRIARLIDAIKKAVPVPVTVKLRTGWSEGEQNVSQVARACEEAGASAVIIHGRAREQRYTRAADWDLIGRVAAERRIPVIGNGDILTHFEARDRLRRSGTAGAMIGRGALIKPWVFREVREDREWLPTAEQRLGVVWRLTELLRDHFGDDDRGRERILGFLPWHLGFFCRYRPLPEETYASLAAEGPLIHRRFPTEVGLEPLEDLLRDPRPEVHLSFSRALLDSRSLEEARESALRLATGRSPSNGNLAAEDGDFPVAG